ncbi:DUF4397 domain-containing protein [Pedobacter mucosus]|uniref:DUF4397 domain-containing protein n=1 Tax=Pedobacter mucosus TaxID=2895286 RepID=UPI001EE4317B|nr:DUF4397 domain-containing protein [Pedobacter mucosus]UKT63600.1 DUF4397 domain-containing protein [Pedobacter mucosus]
MKKILYFFVVGMGLLTACKKGELVENTPYEKIAPADPKYSYIKILNLTPGSPVANYYIDGTKFSASLSSTGIENTGYSYNILFPDFGYAVTTPGTHKLTAKIVPAAAADANLEILNTTINPVAGKYYSLFTTGQYTTTSKTIPSVLTIEDIRPALDTAKIFVRFVNLANGSPNIDVVKGADLATGTKIISNVAYGASSSGWVEIPALGAGTAPIVPIWFVNSATGASIFPAVLSLTITKGRAYTIYSRGIVGTTGTTLPTYTFYTTFF